MKKIGITGGIGSGKSTVSEYLIKERYDMLFRLRPRAVKVAPEYPAMLYSGLTIPYSLCMKVAFVKAMAVCPEGNEFRVADRKSVV